MLRFAPSPTGDIHIENLRIAIFNYIISKQLKKNLIIRIEDIDTNNNIEDYDKRILEILDLFGISYINITHQSQNIKFYRQFAMQLLTQKKAFNCFCSDSDKDIQKSKNIYNGGCDKLEDYQVIDNEKPFKVRIKKPNRSIKFIDNLKGEYKYLPSEIDSFVILKEDKTPTYNFACAIDDMLLDISYIIRSKKHITNTPKQIHIRNELNYNKDIQYLHLSNIIDINTNKQLTIKDNIASVEWLLDNGFLPSAIANYLVLIGNKLPNNINEIFDIDEAIQWFDIKNLSLKPVKYDFNKLKFINKKHIEKLDNMRLSKLLGFADEDIGKLAKIYLNEVSTLKELKTKIQLYFKPKNSLKDFDKELKILKNYFNNSKFIDNFDKLQKDIINKTKLQDNKLSIPLRYILTGDFNGPKLSDIYPLIKNYIGEITK